MAQEKNEIQTYLEESKSLVLGTADEGGNPQLRFIGGYGVEDLNIYFSTGKGSDKVGQIASNENVVLLFQHEGQILPKLKNITIYGKAELLKEKAFEQGTDIIKKRKPQAQISRETSNIYRINTRKVKILNLSSNSQIQTFDIKELL